MKKARKSGSARKSRSSSSRGIFSRKSSSGKKKLRSSSMGKSVKHHRNKKVKNRFLKQPHDPGPKIREEEVDVSEYLVEDGEEPVQQALQSTGRGCCSSITGFFWFLGLGGLTVIIILVLKCGGC